MKSLTFSVLPEPGVPARCSTARVRRPRSGRLRATARIQPGVLPPGRGGAGGRQRRELHCRSSRACIVARVDAQGRNRRTLAGVAVGPERPGFGRVHGNPRPPRPEPAEQTEPSRAERAVAHVWRARRGGDRRRRPPVSPPPTLRKCRETRTARIPQSRGACLLGNHRPMPCTAHSCSRSETSCGHESTPCTRSGSTARGYDASWSTSISRAPRASRRATPSGS